MELDNALRGADGKGPGLKMFQAPPDWQEKSEVLAGLPCALVSGDQGGDLWTAENSMDSDLGRLNYVQEPDVFNHGIHNDLVGTSLDPGFGPLMYALQVAVNLPFLPFRDGRYVQRHCVLVAAKTLKYANIGQFTEALKVPQDC